jgi:hypothetical protein
MARLVYACRFEVQDKLSAVAEKYREWFIDRYSDLNFDPLETSQAGNLPDQHSLSSKFYSSDEGSVSCISWFFPDDKDRGLRWINDIRLGQFGDLCSIEHKILIDSLEYNIAPVRLDLGPPRIVRDLCFGTPINVNEIEFRATPYILDKNSQLQGFLQMLFDKRRSVPFVFLSPYARGEGNLIDANQLALNLAGVAAVVEVTKTEIIWDFTNLLKRELSCFNGAARIYWPGFSQEDDPHTHRLFLASWIEKVGPDFGRKKIEKTVFSVAAFRFVPDQRISDIILTVEKERRQENIRQLRKDKDEEFWEKEALEFEEKLNSAEDEIRNLEIENKNLKANQKVLFTDPMSLEENEVSDEPTSILYVSDAVNEAANRTHNIEFLDSAYSSAGASPFKRPSEIYDALIDLDQIVDEWREQRDKKGSGGDLLQHLRGRGWNHSSMHISDTAKTMYRNHYEFAYNGEKQLFEPHITIGSGNPNSCASIHFVFDQEQEKMIVAHVGKHLPNTKT